jgi:hypothetical protein
MADLQQSVVSDPETKQQINNQIVQWEENLERLHCEQFRLRCYMASLQSGELPNPKVIQSYPNPMLLIVCIKRESVVDKHQVQRPPTFQNEVLLNITAVIIYELANALSVSVLSKYAHAVFYTVLGMK